MEKYTLEIITIVIAFLALIVAGWTFYDNNFIFKLSASVGKHVKIYIMNLDSNIKKPCIFMNVSLINNGGKTESIEDVKLEVELSFDNVIGFKQEFVSVREFTDIFNDGAPVTELLPIVVSGKSNTVKKYIFIPVTIINQNQIPSIFDLKCTVFVKQRGKWSNQKICETKNITNVWQDLNSLTTSNSLIIEVNELS